MPADPRIDALVPDHGPAGTTVAIEGEHFDTDRSKLRVQFGGKPADVYEVDPEGMRVTTRVPVGAASGAVLLVSGSDRVSGPIFTVEPDPAPVLGTVEPAAVASAEWAALRLRGSGFSPRSVVQWDGTNLSTTFLSTGELYAVNYAVGTLGEHVVRVVTDPPGGGTSGDVSVTVAEGFALTNAVATGPTTIRIDFDAAVDVVSGQDPAHYVVRGLVVGSATVDETDPRHVSLAVIGMTGRAYELYVFGLTSAAGAPLGHNGWNVRGYRYLPAPVSTIGRSDCGKNGFSGPSGVSFNDPWILVTERTGHQVQTLAPGGSEFLAYWGLAGSSGNAVGCPGDAGTSSTSGFSGPMGQVIDGTYVGDTGNHRILRKGTAGATTFGSGFVHPVIVGYFDGKLWVAGSDERIRRVGFNLGEDPAIGGPGRGPGQFSFGITEHVAPGAARAAAGVVLVTDPLNHRVQRFVNGAFAGMYGGGIADFTGAGTPPAECCFAGTGAGWLTRPRGIAIDRNGSVWIVDEGNGGRLVHVLPDGTFVASMNLGYVPSAIGIDSLQDRIWIADETNDTLRVLN